MVGRVGVALMGTPNIAGFSIKPTEGHAGMKDAGRLHTIPTYVTHMQSGWCVVMDPVCPIIGLGQTGQHHLGSQQQEPGMGQTGGNQAGNY